MNDQMLHPNVRGQLALVRRDLKSQSKNDVVRAVLGLLVEVAKKDGDLKKAQNLIEALKNEAAKVDGFLKQNEEAFQAYLDALPKEEPVTTEGSASEPTQAIDDQKVG